MIVGTAGHIDHGKTTLVKALTGVDTDRLKEEKARGITIDLGFAYARFAKDAVTGFVDVPGHERFIHTMLAGRAASTMPCWWLRQTMASNPRPSNISRSWICSASAAVWSQSQKQTLPILPASRT